MFTTDIETAVTIFRMHPLDIVTRPELQWRRWAEDDRVLLMIYRAGDEPRIGPLIGTLDNHVVQVPDVTGGRALSAAVDGNHTHGEDGTDYDQEKCGHFSDTYVR